MRIILDSKLKIPLNSKVLRDNNVLIATSSSASKSRRKLLEKRGIKILVFKDKKIPLEKLLSVLAKEGIISIFVEGGGEILGSFIDAKIIDKVYAFYAPILVGGEKAVTIGGRGADKIQKSLSLKNVSIKRIGDNFLVEGYPKDNK